METVDTIQKAQKLNDNRTDQSSILNVYLQINTSEESQKSGLWNEDEALEIATFIVEKCPRLNFKGLMTIGSLSTSLSDGENKDFTVSF